MSRKPALYLDEEEFQKDLDFTMEALSCLISPKEEKSPNNNYGAYSGPISLSTNGSTSTVSTKISPLLTEKLDEVNPGPESLRGINSKNELVFSSSQTPYGFQAMTKRKTSKQSIFNFEGFDNPNSESQKNEEKTESSQETPDSSSDKPKGRRILRTKLGTRQIGQEKIPMARPAELPAHDSFDDKASKFVDNFSDLDRIPIDDFDGDVASSWEVDQPQLIPTKDPMSSNPRKKLGIEAPQVVLYPQDTINYYQDKSNLYPADSLSNFPLPSISMLQANISNFQSYEPHLKAPENFEELSNYQNLIQKKVQEMKITQNYPDSSNLSFTNQTYPLDERSKTPVKDLDPSSTNSRASKSLAEISRRFVQMYGRDNSMDYIAGLLNADHFSNGNHDLNRVDGAAEALNVHVRRIYELIKILEILSLVEFAGDKRGQFSWRGTKDFLFTLGTIQNDGINNYPKLAQKSGIVEVKPTRPPLPRNQFSDKSLLSLDLHGLSASDDMLDWTDFNRLLAESPSFLDNNQLDFMGLSNEPQDSEQSQSNPSSRPIRSRRVPPTSLNNSKPMNSSSVPQPNKGGEEQFMVEIICKRFLQLFLVGMNSLSMSNAIQKLIPMEPNQTLSDYNKQNATKIRRVYDVTNVLCSLNLIQKKSISKIEALDAETRNNIDNPHSIGIDLEGKGKDSTPAKGSDRAETKVLEWTSFTPLLIRERYLSRIFEEQSKISQR